MTADLTALRTTELPTGIHEARPAGRSHRRAWLLAGALLGAAASGCQSKPEPSPATDGDFQTTSPFDAQEALSRGFSEEPRFVDEDFVLEARPASKCAARAPFLPAPGFERISVPIEVQSRTARVVPISPLAFSLRDTEGHVFGATLAGCKPAIASSRLQDGRSLSGDVAFDVPDGSERLEMVFEPFLVGRPRVRARVLVTRK